MAARKSPVSTIDYTFSNVDWSALPADALAAIGQTPATQPAAPAMTMTPQEAEAAAAMALGQPTGRPPVEAALPDQMTVIEGGLPEQAAPAPTAPETTSAPAPVPTPEPVASPAPAAPSDDAVSILRDVLKEYGLDSIADEAYKYLVKNPTGTSEDFLRSLRGTDAYKTRFAGNAARVKAGLPELTPSEYVGMERAYQNIFQYYNIPTEFYDQTSDFQKLIEGNVDVYTLRDRVEGGFVAVRDSSPDVIKQMKELYGVEESQLAAYFLDPTRGANILRRQAQAAKVGAAASQGGVQLGVSLAEQLAAENVSPEQVRQSAAVVTRERQVQEALQAGETTISQEEALQADLGLSEAAAQRIRQRKARRIAEFQQGGGFAQTQTGITGLRTVGQ